MKKERKRLRILGKEYKVIWWDEIPGDFGVCQPDELKIHLSRNYPDSEKITTVLHEALEAFNNKLILKINHDTISRLDGLLYAFLSDQGVNMRPLIEEKGDD